MRAAASLLIVCATAWLGACTERPQTAGGARQDAPAYTGTGKAYAVQGWKQGDKASWEQQMRARGLSMNEYNRTQP